MRSFRPTRAVLAVTSVVAGLVLATASVAEASLPGRNGLLSVSYGFKCPGARIATLDPGSGRLRMLTPAGCAEGRRIGRASWSPDGRRLTFEYELPVGIASNAEWSRFAVMNADGSARRDIALAPAPLTAPGPSMGEVASFRRSDPSFTPDGKRVIYTRWLWRPPVYPTELWTAGLDGTDDRRIAAGGGFPARISPDGGRIAYVQTPRRQPTGTTPNLVRPGS
jgi:Tol biopolymer transport system component